jgi:hypothetical protein
MYATDFPSGDHRASVAFTVAEGHWRGVPPADGITYVTVVRLFFATSVVRREYKTDAPDGETCGSPTFRTAAKSSKVIARFCAAATDETLINRNATIRAGTGIMMFMSSWVLWKISGTVGPSSRQTAQFTRSELSVSQYAVSSSIDLRIARRE